MLRLVPDRIGGEPSLFRFSAIERLMFMIERKGLDTYCGGKLTLTRSSTAELYLNILGRQFQALQTMKHRSKEQREDIRVGIHL